MMTISKAIGAARTVRYHQEDLTHDIEEGELRAEWHGKLAADLGLEGRVNESDFARLALGQHPQTGEQLVEHQTPRQYRSKNGTIKTTMAHRAGADITLSAPKSVSVTALPGGDDAVRTAHDDAVRVAADFLEGETYAHSRPGQQAEQTGQWATAMFRHDRANPVKGHAAPQLHTHLVVFNMTRTADGEIRALEPKKLYQVQKVTTSVYRSELVKNLQQAGYDITRDDNGVPDITGYSPDYLEANSPRKTQIEAAQKFDTPASRKLAVYESREPKHSEAEDQASLDRALAERFGDQPQRIVQHAQSRGPVHTTPERQVSAEAAMTYARDKNFERDAAVKPHALLKDALDRSMGSRTSTEIRAEYDKWKADGRFIETPHHSGRVTTPEMVTLEKENLSLMMRHKSAMPELATPSVRSALYPRYEHLNTEQREAVAQVLSNTDQVQALEGIAGSGKTTALAAIAHAATREGYTVEGVAPLSGATEALNEAGIPSQTLQAYLQRTPESQSRTLYMMDESSMTATKQMHQFLTRLESSDRVILVGDVRQHEAVDAGKPYQQMHDAGISVTHLDRIIRQHPPELKAVVKDLSEGKISDAVSKLDHQGRVHEVKDDARRYQEIADRYVQRPNESVVISDTNESRKDLNHVVHRTMQRDGHVEPTEQRMKVMIARQDMTGADRTWAKQYLPNDVIRYTKGSKKEGIKAGTYSKVMSVDTKTNTIKVKQGGTHREVTYDPARLRGVMVYRAQSRDFAVGDKVQFTAPDKERGITTRTRGVITQMDKDKSVTIKLDNKAGNEVTLSGSNAKHLDYGYAMTSHSFQGKTAAIPLINSDTTHSAHTMNKRYAYVSVSRAQRDVHVYTNSKSELPTALSRATSRSQATEHKHASSLSRPGSQAHTTSLSSLSHPSSSTPSSSTPHTAKPIAQGNAQGKGQSHGQGQSQGVGI